MKIYLISVKILVSIFWLTFLLIVAGTFLPYNPLTPPLTYKTYVVSVFPQGWGFFTRAPQESNLYIYVQEGDTWKNASRMPNSSLQNLLGLKRSARSQGSESGILINTLAEKGIVWHEAKSMGHLKSLADTAHIETIQIKNTVKNTTLCGALWFVTQGPIPWAWSKHADNIDMPIHYLKLNIICDESDI